MLHIKCSGLLIGSVLLWCLTCTPAIATTGTIRLAVIGDSIAGGWGTSNPPVTKFPAQVTIPGHRITLLDEAQGGALVAQMFPYVSAVRAFHPSYAVIELGTNDQRWYHSQAQFAADYARMLQALRGIPHIACLGIWPSPGHLDTAPYNATIHRLCGGSYLSIQYIATPANTNPANWHPNDRGARALADRVSQWMEHNGA